MESRHCGQDKRIIFCPVHNASTPCSFQAFGIRCIGKENKIITINRKYASNVRIQHNDISTREQQNRKMRTQQITQ